MITERFVIIPVERAGIIPIGVGSVNINPDGHMAFVIGIDSFGKELQEKFREGKIRALRISSVEVDQ